jgi:excisionase family DNA binding protein
MTRPAPFASGNPRAYTVASLAAAWGCSEGVIRKAIHEGRLGCFRIGTLIRIPAEEVARFECQNTPSNDSGEATPSSTETPPDDDTESDYRPRTVLGRKRRLGGDGPQGATVHRGPWGASC